MAEPERSERLHEAIRDVVTHVKARDEEELERAMRPTTNHRRRLVPLLLLTWVAIGWIWLARPEFVFGPDARQESPARREASLRFGMVLEMARAREFRSRTHRWPASLGEVPGQGEEGVTGVPTGAGYLISGAAGELRLELTDRMATDSFLGNSLQILKTVP